MLSLKGNQTKENWEEEKQLMLYKINIAEEKGKVTEKTVFLIKTSQNRWLKKLKKEQKN